MIDQITDRLAISDSNYFNKNIRLKGNTSDDNKDFEHLQEIVSMHN